MALKFAYRGTSLTQSHYATGWQTFLKNSDNQVDPTLTAAPAGCFGATVLNMTTGPRGIFPGAANCPIGTTNISMLWRIVPHGSGAPATSMPLASPQGGGVSRKLCGIWSFIINSAGKLLVGHQKNDTTAVFAIATVPSTAFTFVQDVPTDIGFAWDGTTTAGHGKITQDGVLIATLTATSTGDVGNRTLQSEIRLDNLNSNLLNTLFDYDEILIFDSYEDFTGAPYAGRTAYYNVAAFEGYAFTDPGVANVKNGTAYTYAGATQTGTLATGGGASGSFHHGWSG